MSHDIRRKGRTSRSATIAAASILELHLLTRPAQAQEATEDISAFQDIASVEGVASVETLDNGSVELTMEDGSVLTVPAGEVQILNGTVFVSDSFLIAQGLTASSNNTVLLLTLGAVGVAVAANALESSSDSDDDVVPPGATPPPPPPPPMPPVFTSSASASVAENQTDAYRAVATDADSDTLSYSLSGTDASRFMIDAATGEVRFIEAPDFEAPGDADADNVYDIIVTASDGANTAERTVAIMVTDENEAPIFTSDAAVSVDENQTVDSVVYTAMATDADGDDLSYNLSGTDAARFMIDAATGEVRFIEAPDFENPGDADGDNVYDIVVTASDGTSSTDQAVAITVTDENDSPIFTSDAAVSVAENQTVAYTALATDADGDDLSYNLSGTDAALFMIDATTGEVRFIEAPDFEAPGDADGDNIYDIVVTTSDGTSSTDQAVAITVTDENDGTAFQRLLDNPQGASVADFEAAGIERVDTRTVDAARELLQAVGENDPATLAALTPQQVQAIVGIARDHIVSITGPEDAGIYDSGEFTLGSNPAIVSVEAGSFIVSLDYDGDGETDHIANIEFDADYRVQRVERDFGADNAPDDPPDAVEVVERPDDRTVQITYDIQGDGDTDRIETYTLDESGDRIQIDVDTDADGSTDRVESYEVDADGNRIQIDFDDNADGEIDRTELDDDADGNPDRIETYTLDENGNRNRVRTDFDNDSDGTIDRAEFDDDADGATDRSEIYTYDASGNRVRTDLDDNADGNIDRAEFDNDADGTTDRSETYTYDASGNRVRTDFDDNNDGTIDRTDFDDSTPIDNTPIDNTPINNTPNFTSGATVSVAENQTEAYTAAATDADGDTLRYSLSGTDAALFTIDPNTGVVRFIASPDFEMPGDDGGDNVYDINVTATDNINDRTQAVAITVTNVNDNTPSFTSPDSASVAENQTLAYTAVATDADGGNPTYSLFGTDAALFIIDPNTGVVSFREAPDFEAPGDDGGDNVYDIVVRASDGTNHSDQRVAITVTDINEDGNPPVFTSPATADVAENQTLAYTAVATDADGDPLTYSLSGTDAGRFTINAATGVVSFNEAPDVEAPSDANGDNVYDIIVTASDNTGGTPDTNQAVAITVTGVNDNAPVFTSPATANVEENQTAAYTALATDADGDPLTYSLSGTDAARFTINPATGVVSFNEAPDVEAPSDANGDNVYDIVVTASDNTGGTPDTNQAVAITVTNVNDNAPVFTSPDSASVAENQTSAYTAMAADADAGDVVSYRLSGGADVALFTIDETTGVVSFMSAPDFENAGDADTNNVYEITVAASDGTRETPHDVAITVTDVLEVGNAPTFSSPGSASVEENQMMAYTAMATDADGDDLSYSLSGTDAALFTIDPATGVVSFIASPDFEDPGDAGGDNVYNIVVTATDGPNRTNQPVAITVTNVNDNAPVFTSPATANVEENRTAAYTAVATDADGDSLRYSLSGTDAALFTINETTGEVSFNEAPDVEDPDDANGDNVYNIIVTASDNTGGTTDTNQAVAITVTGVNDNSPVFTSPATANVEENQTAAYTALATDADGDPLTYSLSGTDAGLFTINAATGEVSFNEAPDAENPDDANGDNVYDIIVTASDGTTANDIGQAVAITVTGVNDNAPVFNSPATANAEENQTVAYTAVATDGDGDDLSYSLSGTDAGLFTIDPTTGEVSFNEAPDVENPDDANGDNVYNIVVTASDNTGGTPDTTQAVAITVTGVNDNAPVFTSPATASLEENQTAAYTAVATDADGDPLTYSLSGTDAARFTINETTGEVSFNEAPDVENPDDANGDNVYNIVVTASDNTGGTSDTNQAVAITVTGVNDSAPVFTSPATASVEENQTAAYTAVATDGDGDPLTYSLSGTDAARFTINETTGEVSFNEAPDAENPDDANGDNVYDIVVTASDNTGGTPDTNQAVAITVTGVNDNAPVFTSPATASVEENQTAAYTAVATDGDGDPLTYSLSGTDAARFTINETTGEVSFNEAPDAENPDDANRDNVYDIVVTASDNIGGTPDTNQAVAITVTGVNDNAPVFTSPATATVEENQTAAYTALAMDGDGDGDGDPLTYSLSGTDAALFTINETTGEVSFNEAPDVEDPDDANGDNVYDIVVTASDNTSGTPDTNQAVAITVTNVNDNAPVFNSPATATVEENQTAAYTAVATDADGDSLRYSLSGTDAALFTINETTGEVSFSEAPDAENPDDANGDNVYDITVTASDGTTANDINQAVAITVTGVNDNGPVFNSPATANVEENQTAAYTAVATDADGDPVTYSLSGTDAGRFTINAATGVVSFNEAPDVEAPSDANGDNVYDIIVTASDNTGGTIDTNQAVAITVTNVNDNDPVFTSPATASVAENQTAAYTAMATDADEDPLTYSLSGADAELFAINRNTGVVSFKAAPDFEMPGDANEDNDYNITVTASDGENMTNHDVVITVTDEDEIGNAPVFTSPATASVAENQTAAYTAVATDADEDPLTYSLSGADASLFTIDENTGMVSFIVAPDFENPGDAGGNNVYDITVTASDGINDTPQAVTITVTNVNDNTPVFTSPNSASVAENQTAAYTAVATDADGDDLSYSLSGTDAALFTIDPTTGEVSFIEAPDFENPGDVGGDNVYDITVTASDDDSSTNHDVTITVTNENDSDPIFNSGNSAGVAENQNVDSVVYTAMATDADGDTLSYSLSGTDAARFTINPNTGAVRFIASPDFENPDDAGGNNVYDITVTASDDDSSTDHDVAITVTNINDNTPSFTSPDSANVAENETLAYTAVATDADGDDLSYSLSGTDAALFTIDPATGEVRFRAAPDFEDPGDAGRDNVYDITVTASDDDSSTNHDVTITVTNENDSDPIFNSGNSAGVVENQNVDSVVYTAMATDADGDTLSYSLSGADAARFTVDPNTGAVRFIASPDFENPDDAGGDNVYNITVTASDDDNSTDHDVAITVTNINDNTPSFTSPDSANVAENETLAYTAAATDADGDDLSYSLSGTDAALFTIDSNTGAVNFIAPPDFEDPGDAGGDNVYDITVTASDDDSSTNHDVTITVTNENDNDPIFNSGNSAGVAENQNVDSVVYTAMATGADGDTLSYSLSGADASRFTIDPNTGAVRFIASPDFENPGDAGGDNVYDITVTASDDDNSTDHDVAITVTNINDNTPSFTSPDSANVAENETLAYTAVATDADGDDLSYSLSGTDAALFTIDSNTGAVSFIASPDFEDPGDAGGDNVYNITVTASDDTNESNHDVTITVTNENDNDPIFNSGNSAGVAENQNVNSVVYTAMATDADGDTLSYSLSGTDASRFTIDPNTGAVRFIASPDFENPDDAGGDNVYDITVTASDDDNSTDHDVAITVTNVNDNTPSFTSPDSANVAENETLAYTAVATDADGDDLTYSLSGTDAALFTIDPATGVVSFIASPNFENPNDAGGDNVYNITVTASDDTNESNHDVAITVTNENDNDPIFISGNSVDVAENQPVDSVVYTAIAADADGDTLTYGLSGTDASLFTIDPATGDIRFITAPDVEAPGDANRDNVYEITVTASDDTNDIAQAVAITVTNINEDAPSFTSPDSASVAENQTVAYTAAATDADGDPLMYSLSGTDAALFTIDPATGVVSFITPPDFEDPGDAGGNNIYNITVTASDGDNSTNHNVAITVTNENDNDPIFTSDASASVAENQPTDSAVYTAQATDEDGDNLTYSLSGTDAARFTIDPATGAVSFIASPDFENPDDVGGNNVYDITVTASDDDNSTDHDVAITVTNVNDNNPIFTSDTSVDVAENQTAAYTAVATDADGDPLTYSLSGTDAARFTINAASGVVSFSEAPDAENPDDANGDNIYDIIVTASDNIGGTPDANQAVAITVTGVNDNAPVFTSPATASVEENQTAAYTALATDADGDPLTYSLSGTDAALFTINAATGVVSFNEAPDAENPDDANRDNVYDIVVTASDNTGGTPDTTQAVAITVTGVNDNAPVFTSPATASVEENQTAAYTALATDGDGDALTYSLSGTDAGRFTINAATGVVSFNEAPDVENPDDANGDNVYDIVVTASDNTGGTPDTTQAVAITVTGVNDNAPVFTSPATASVEENQTAAYTALATDGDGDALTYSLSGTDAGRFTINAATSVVSFNEAPDVENPDDANGDNVYDIVVTASDNTSGTPDTTQAVAITVTGANDNAPVFISPATANVEENQTAAYTALAMDADGDPLTYSLSGTDAGLFTIDPATGEVSFNEAPDAENPDDANGDNVYDIVVTASDNTGGTPDTTQAVAITVTGVNDNAPVFTSPATASVEENQTAAYTTLATDGDGDPLTYSLSGTDAGLFTIDPATGVVSFNEAPDAENPDDANGDNVYDIVVTASDNTGGTPDTTQAVAITVTGVNDNAPVFTSPAMASVEENQTAAYTALATDADGDPLTYSLSGTDAARFTIDPATGVVSFNEAPDAENPDDANGDNVYDIVVTASDNTGGTPDTTQAVAITVTGVNDNAPVFTSPATANVEENQTAAYTAVAVDADGDPLTYSLSGTDAGLFTIDPATGVVSFNEAPDIENPDDANGDNVYDIVVTASDNTEGTPDTNQSVAITVTGVNDNAPVFTSPDSASVEENQTMAYMAMATDADGDSLTYSLSGTDAARFSINAATGVVSFITPPDFEDPGDAGGNNIYNITVTASDGDNSTNHNVAITVTNENDNDPIFTSDASASVAENQPTDSAVYTAQATDEDGDNLTYSLSGTDAARFTIDPATGAVSFIASPDFENPDDAGGNNVYDITVTASDDDNSTDHDVAITVTNVNDNNPIFTSDTSVDVAENQTAAYTAVATDADGDPLTYSLSGTDAALFMIDATTGVVSFIEAPDFEVPGSADGDNVYDITVTASDGDNSAEQAVAITVTDENEVGSAPVFTSPDSASVEENQTMAYMAMATDADGDSLTYSLSGTDAARFSINAATGVVSFMTAPDFEDPGDAGGDNVYDITVTASDGDNSTDHDVTITVTGVNDNAPVFSSPATASVAENQRSAYTAVATDADGDPLTYSLSGTDAALFTIDPATGVVSFMTAPDFEAPGSADGDNVYDITVTASDGDNSAEQAVQAVAITVTDENEVGSVPVFTSPDSASVEENQTMAYTAMATDADGDSLTYSLSGTDAALFMIDATTGVVSFIEAPDFEVPGSADGDNVYEIIVTASDNTGGTTDANQAVAITVTGVNDNTPVFTSPATASVAENQRSAYTAVATDADGDPLTYSLSGTDAALFMIDATTGVVSFIEAPDFEVPGSADGDNVYDITVTASDGDNSAEQAVAITVTDENEVGSAPVFTSPDSASVEENQTMAYIAMATDADGDSLTYSLSGTDAALFMIDATTGVVSFIEAPDFEVPGSADGDNVYDITVTASDGDNSAEQAVAITVTDENEVGSAPVFTAPDSASVEENQTMAYMAMATDADGDSLTYSLSGTDAARFSINAATGVVSFITPPDFEDPGDAGGNNIYNITVTASDGDNSTNHNVAITVTNENDNDPIFTSDASASVAENQPTDSAVYTAQATDEDGDNLTYSLSGTDAARFTIDPATGAVSFIASPDFENPDDAGGNNVYDITVTASDDDNSTDHDVAITVTNVNDNNPIFTSDTSVDVAENQTAAYTAVATDADGDPLTYSLSGTDAALFMIDATTGVVSFIEAPDFEVPGSADGDNVYDITVTASDGDNSAEQAVAITVTDENEVGSAPVFTSPDSASVEENQTMAYMAMATDADGDSLTYSLSGTDAARFSINAATGVVSFMTAPDFEDPGDAGGDNVYDITVTASDGDNSTDHDVTITVTGVNDNAPVFSSPATASVAENQRSAYTAVATDADGDPLTYSLSGTDAALFTIDPATGVVSFMTAPDFEAPGSADGDNVYDITVTASDGDNSAEQAVQAVAITVTDENEVGSVPVFTSPDSASVEENQTMAYTAMATDADGDSLTYSLSGTDAALFMIDATTGVVSFIEAPDFEVPGSADGDNVYEIIVTASDNTGGTTDANQAVAITVTGVNDNTPVFTSPATASVAENQRSAYTAVATDADGDPLTYSLSGTDAALFMIDATTGVVSFIEAPDFEVPGSADGDNVYDITVTASDGDNSAEQAVAITVTDENEVGSAPVFTSPDSASVEENQTMAYIAMATDADGDSLTYSLSGTDAALFMIDATTGVVSFIEAPDFEVPGSADGDNVYDITVTASDGDNSAEQAVAITVTDENEVGSAPVFTAPDSASVEENQTMAYMAMATDADGDSLTYSLSGTDAARFSINAATGVVSFITPPDFEDPGDAGGNNIYNITVTASDGDNSTNHNVAITVTNENDNDPIFTSDASASVAENQPTDSAVYTAQATDEDGDNLTYSLSGTDAARFTIDPATGAVSFIASPDFENPDDAGGNNVYDITVTASDDDNSTDHDVAITVTNVNDNTPSFTSPATASVEENRTAAYTALATDADGDPLTYSLSGTDAARFSINAATGVVSFITPPDFEDPGDAGGNNIYNITVTASDGDNSTNHNVAITVTNENDNDPIFTSDASASVAENQPTDSAVYTAQATDEDGDNLTYSLSGTDAARFTIDPATGAVSFIASPDFENPDDAGGNNVYDITVTASDDDNSTDHDVAITVTNVNDNTPSFTSPATASVEENRTAAYTALATDADGDPLTYSLSGTDAARFSINAATGVVSFITPPDFEDPGDVGGNNIYNITVTASDGDNSTNHNVAITVTDKNEVSSAPVFTSPDSASVEENQTMAYMAMATDADGDPLTYSLSGTDAALFMIDATTGVVSFIEAPDFEVPGSADGDNVYDITVTASDGDNSAEQAVAITVTDENEVGSAPVFTSPDSASVEENQTMAYMAMATDADGDSLTYSLSGTDAARFSINAATGVVSFITPPDFEDPGDAGGNNIYNITVTASDGDNSTNHNVAITVTNENDNDPIFTSDASASVAENQPTDSAVYTAQATDEDGDNLTYSLSGTDAARFTIDPATGAVSFIASPDFENPDDAGGNNVYDITVTASDDDNSTDHDVAITVTNVNDNTPSFTSPATASVEENRTAAYTALATDADGDPLTYSLSGTDAARFSINAATGVVSFITPPDFEDPGDAGGNNIYNITVTASDGDNSTNHNVAITVTDENEVGSAPVFTSPDSASVEENQTMAYMAMATDADGDSLTYSLSGTDAARFSINAATGVVSFMTAPDFEDPGDAGGDNVYDITVTASDGDNSTDHDVTITVTGVNDNAPVFSSPATASVAENQRSAYTAVATDADGDVLSYSLSGTDAALFTIDPATGVVSFRTPPDFEMPGSADGDNVYDITVTASDGDNSAEQAVAITVTDENEVGSAPVFTSPDSASVEENQTMAYIAMATDADGDSLTYSLSGTDAALFMIDATTGVVSFIEAPDFEVPGSADGDNVYEIIVTASDNTSGTTDANQAVAITVTGVNDNTPVFTSPATASVAENQRSAYTAVATDADGDPLTYSLSGTDAALFMIDATTGVVSFIEAPDFEVPGSADGDNVYDITVTASDGDNSAEQAVAITVTDENEVGSAPVFTSPDSASVEENQTMAYMAMATDADGDSLTYSLSGTDAARFSINAATGVVSFIEAPTSRCRAARMGTMSMTSR